MPRRRPSSCAASDIDAEGDLGPGADVSIERPTFLKRNLFYAVQRPPNMMWHKHWISFRSQKIWIGDPCGARRGAANDETLEQGGKVVRELVMQPRGSLRAVVFMNWITAGVGTGGSRAIVIDAWRGSGPAPVDRCADQPDPIHDAGRFEAHHIVAAVVRSNPCRVAALKADEPTRMGQPCGRPSLRNSSQPEQADSEASQGSSNEPRLSLPAVEFSRQVVRPHNLRGRLKDSSGLHF